MSSFLSALPPPPLLAGDDPTKRFTAAWAGWFAQAQVLLFDAGNSGTTAQRPTTYLYVGKPYFDTTLGLPVWLKTPVGPVWVNGAGAAV